jgi:transposase
LVKWVRSGRSYRVAARKGQVSVATVALWMKRARDRPLSEVDWADRSHRPHRLRTRTARAVVRAIKRLRRQLRQHDALGEYGPAAIRRQLQAQGWDAPSQRTIARWLAREGLSGRERWRRPPPPKGWYLPEVAAGQAELDSCDVVEGLRLRGSRRVEVLNILGLWGCLASSTVRTAIRTQTVIDSLDRRWRQHGRPVFLQCDNDTIFSGAHAQRRYLGRLVHWCLCAGVVPVFTPPCELGFQAAIEAYNRRWQERVWRRWRHPDLTSLQRRSAAFITAYNGRPRAEVARAPWRKVGRALQLTRVVLLRRLDADGYLELAAQRLRVAPAWANRLVRCEVNTSTQHVCCYGLRRRDPTQQPLLATGRLHLDLVPWWKPPS